MANGSTCRSFGTRKLKFTVDGRVFLWPFVIAEVTQPLLGADFLCDKVLMVDLKGKGLVESTTFRSWQLQLSDVAPQRLHYFGRENDYAAILSSFPDLLTPQFATASTKHGGTHVIHIEGRPLHSQARRLPPEKLSIAKEEFLSMEDKQSVVRASAYGAQELW